MECWICKRPAQAICIFCGRAVCQEHAQMKPAVKNVFRSNDGSLKAIVVEGGIWCGKCKPFEYPVDITDFDVASEKTTDAPPEVTEESENSGASKSESSEQK